MASIYFKKPATFTSSELRLRLPVDETSFELGVHSTLPGEHTSLPLDIPYRSASYPSFLFDSSQVPPDIVRFDFAARRFHL